LYAFKRNFSSQNKKLLDAPKGSRKMSIGADKIAVTCWQVACHGKKLNNISKCSNQNSANFVCNSASLALVYEN